MSGEMTPLDTARAGYRAGISVVPPVEDGTKRPETARVTRAELATRFSPEVVDAILGGPEVDERVTWKQWQYERPSPDDYRRWYANGRTGVGAACGRVSGNLEVLEFDDADTYRAFKEAAVAVGLDGLVRRVEAGYCEESAGGGIHWLYRCDVIGGNDKLARRPGAPDAMGRPSVEVLIETRGEGGFIVLAPSHGSVHPAGKAYRLISGSLSTIAPITPEERAQLWELARGFDELPEVRRGVAEAAEPTPLSGEERRPGDDYEARGPRWADLLEPHGWSFMFQRGKTEYWCRPGKRGGISATINGAGIVPDHLYVFSSSTTFPPNASYSKFGAYAWLEHNGDYQAAARALGAQGYGTPRKASASADRDRPQPREPRPPTSPEDERALLATILGASDPLAALARAAIPADFTVPAHQRVYAAFLRLLRGGKPTDLGAVREEVRREALSEAAANLLAGSPPGERSAETTVAETAAALASLDEVAQAQPGNWVPLADLVSESWAILDQPRPAGVRFGFHDLDRLIGGFRPGHLVVLAARPSMGKSAFALQAAHNYASSTGNAVGIVSLEMHREEVFNRFLAFASGINMHAYAAAVEGPETGERERAREAITAAYGPLSEEKVYVYDSSTGTLPDVVALSKAAHAQLGIKLLMVDYLQLVTGDKHARTRNEEVAAVTRALKLLARQLDIPVLALSQLSRAVEIRADHRPMLSDLRDSGAIEQDADIVMFIYREDAYDKETERRGIVDINVAKHRNGPTDVVEMTWKPETAQFMDISRRGYGS